MALCCDICGQEVEIVRFGGGFVGICCKKIFYNDRYEPQFYIEGKDTDVHLFPQKACFSKVKHN